MKTLLLRDNKNRPYTVLVMGLLRRKYYIVDPDFGLIEMPKITTEAKS